MKSKFGVTAYADAIYFNCLRIYINLYWYSHICAKWPFAGINQVKDNMLSSPIFFLSLQSLKCSFNS